MRLELLHRRACRLIHTFEEGSFARDAAAWLILLLILLRVLVLVLLLILLSILRWRLLVHHWRSFHLSIRRNHLHVRFGWIVFLKSLARNPFFCAIGGSCGIDMVYKVAALDSDTFVSWGFWKHARNPPFFS